MHFLKQTNFGFVFSFSCNLAIHFSKGKHMLHQQIQKEYQDICRLLHGRKVADAIARMRKLVKETHKEYINEQLDELMGTYRNILKHSFAATRDPQREEVYHYLIRTLLELADELRELLLTDLAATNTYRLKHHLERERRPERKEALSLLESLTFDQQLDGILKDMNMESSQGLPSREEALVRIFNIIWLTDKYSDAEMELLHAVCESEQLPWHDKALVVSALTLSLMRFFDLKSSCCCFVLPGKKKNWFGNAPWWGCSLAF
jgi:hypothetical protein